MSNFTMNQSQQPSISRRYFLGECGVGLGKVSAAGQKYEEQVNQVMEQIKSGEISDIPSEVK